MSKPPASSYGQILKSSALIGGSSAFNILLGIVRTKVLALLLGPTGKGLIDAYNSITLTVSAFAGMGIANSGVRQIAEAAGTGDDIKIARTVKTLRRTALALGTLGTLAMLALHRQIARWTFGTDEHAGAIAALAVTIFILAVAGGQGALVQGMRRVGDLARLSVLGAVLGTVLGLPMIYFWRFNGIVPMLLMVAATAIGVSWWFARKIRTAPVELSARQTWQEARALLGLGLAFMAANVFSSGAAYLIRLIIIRDAATPDEGIRLAGLYGSAYDLAGKYVGFVLAAMAADFYPRLTALARNPAEANRLVNEQAEMALLLAAPAVLAALTFAPWALHLFYSAKFLPALDLLRWQLLGVLLQVATFPIGYIIVAKGASRLFIGVEAVINLAGVALSWVLLRRFGLVGLGVAFTAMYALGFALIWFIVSRLTGFGWSRANVRIGALVGANVRIGALVGAATAVVFGAQIALGPPWNLVIGAGVTAVTAALSLRTLYAIVGRAGVSAFVAKVKGHLGFQRKLE